MFRRPITLLIWPTLALAVCWIAAEPLLERRHEFHTGSGRCRHRVSWAGFPLSERVESTSMTRLADSESWSGDWLTYASNDGILIRRISDYRAGWVYNSLRNAALILERREPDAARQRLIAQQLMRCAQASQFERISAWVEQSERPEQRGQPLPEVAGT